MDITNDKVDNSKKKPRKVKAGHEHQDTIGPRRIKKGGVKI